MFDKALFDQIVFDGIGVTQISVSDSGVGTDVVAIKGAIPVADSGSGVETIGIKGIVNIVESKFKKALSFVGADDYVEIGDVFGLREEFLSLLDFGFLIQVILKNMTE